MDTVHADTRESARTSTQTSRVLVSSNRMTTDNGIVDLFPTYHRDRPTGEPAVYKLVTRRVTYL